MKEPLKIIFNSCWLDLILMELWLLLRTIVVSLDWSVVALISQSLNSVSVSGTMPDRKSNSVYFYIFFPEEYIHNLHRIEFE